MYTPSEKAAPAASNVGIDSRDSGGAVTRTYQHGALGTWGSVGIKIDHPTERRLLAFLPEPFMQRCGDNTWSYVYKILEMTTECGQNGMVFGAENGTVYPRESRDIPVTGTYVLKMAGERPITIRCSHFPCMNSHSRTCSRHRQLGRQDLQGTLEQKGKTFRCSHP
jgi:hypothetical protein